MATTIPGNEASFTAWELAALTGGELTRLPDEHAHVTGLVTDSRAVRSGNAFVAVRGESFDGHDFLGAAMDRGAAVVVVERGRSVPTADVAVLEVDDVIRAFGAIARGHLQRWRRRDGMHPRIAAVTGSAGKTTTKDLIAAILSAVGPCHATRGNLNNRIGVPAVALSICDERFAVFELGMSIPGEIHALASIVEPDVAALLNVGIAHAEGFGGSRAGIAREKGAIFESLSESGVAVVNADDLAAHAQLVRTRARRVTFGASSTADVRLVGRTYVADASAPSRVTVARAGETFDVDLPVAGEAAALDLVAAIAVADATVGHGVPSSVIAAAVRSWQPSSGRSNLIELANDVWVIDDSYNANPASMRAALATLDEVRRSGRTRAIAVLGEMRELGPLSEREHEELGLELARRGVDMVIGCGAAIDVSLGRAESAGVKVQRARQAEEAGAVVAQEARPGDVILFKGSRGAAVERALAALVARYPRVEPSSRGAS